MKEGRVSRKVLAAFLVASAVCVMMLASGCRVSDALTEVIYDQTSDIIDYDNPTKIYVNDSTAEQTSEEVAAKETSDDASTFSSTVQNLVIYSSSPNTEGFTAKKSVFSPSPDFEGIEASEEVCFVESDDPGAYSHPPTKPEVEEEPPPPEQQERQAASTESSEQPSEDPNASSDASDGKSRRGNPNNGDPTPEGPGTQDPGGTEPQPAPGEEEGGNGEVPVAYDASDPTADPPKVDCIAAYGPAATIVQMVGGPGALAATDSATLAGNFSRVFDTSSVASAWGGNGADGATLNVDALIASGANTVLVYTGDYFRNSLSAADVERLTNAGITQTVIYPLSNSGDIKQDVRVVAEMLSESTKAAYAADAMTRAQNYAAFHDDVVSRAASAAGGLAGSTVFQGGYDSAVPGFSSGPSVYTLVLDTYENSVYVGPGDGDWAPSAGLAFASAGYSTTPLSYYVQAGGLVNNAADRTNYEDTGKVVAWQFYRNHFAFIAGDWAGAVVATAKEVPSSFSLLTTPNNTNDILAFFGESFGSETSFPKIIVTSPSIKTSLIENSKLSNGTYHPYKLITDAAFPLMGPVEGVASCVGYNGNGSAVNLFDSGQITSRSIVVNPTGLFSDWTQGTVESFLEAAWVNDEVNDSSGSIDWRSSVERFYHDFYGYTLTATDWRAMNPEGA